MQIYSKGKNYFAMNMGEILLSLSLYSRRAILYNRACAGIDLDGSTAPRHYYYTVYMHEGQIRYTH